VLEKTASVNKMRLQDVDKAKGLAILLVVFGHIFINIMPVDHQWYIPLNKVIYKFHMPFFMFLTGLVMFYAYPRIETFGDYFNYVKKKFIRFIPAYLLFAVIVWVGKFLFSRIAQIDRPVTGGGDFVNALIRPRYSHCGSLWYIYVCFIYFMTIPILLKIVKQKLELLIFFALVLHFAPSTTYFALEQVFEYLFIFLLGGYVARHYDWYASKMDRYSYVFTTVFAIAIVLAFLVDIPKLAMGLLSVPALHSFVRWKVINRSYFLKLLGDYTFPIYLMNTMAIGFTMVILRKYLFWDGTVFIVALVLLLSGLFLPIAAQKLFISRIPGLKSIIR
jgi:fucose 4-O-acetylase-like acetyltransferase